MLILKTRSTNPISTIFLIVLFWLINLGLSFREAFMSFSNWTDFPFAKLLLAQISILATSVLINRTLQKNKLVGVGDGLSGFLFIIFIMGLNDVHQYYRELISLFLITLGNYRLIGLYNVKKNYLIPVSENKFCNPKTIYGQHKLFCENLGIAFDKYGNNQNFKIDFRSIRFPGIISINSMPSGGTSDYAPEMIHSAIKNKNYSCFVSEKSRLPFIVMPDAIEAIIKIMTTPKEKLKNNIYNITSFSPSVKDFLKTIQKKSPEFKINYDIDKMREDIVNQWPDFIDDKNAKNDWKWKPKYDLESAFNDYIFKNLEN